MTTEIWIPGLRKTTSEFIPDGKQLESYQKSRLIKNLYTLFPPANYSNTTPLDITQFGYIIDQGDGTTSIRTRTVVKTGMLDLKSNKMAKIKNHNSWNLPTIISNQKPIEVASLALHGYGKKIPILIQNLPAKKPPLLDLFSSGLHKLHEYRVHFQRP